jgi:hypothetical protein
MSYSFSMRLYPVSLLLVFGACQPLGTPQTAPVGAPERLWSFVDTLAVSREAAIARYGPPVSSRSDTTRNQAQPAMLDSIVTIAFRHYEAKYYVHAGRITLRHINVSAPLASLPPQLRPGASAADFIAWLGPPEANEDFENGRLLLYEIGPRTDDEELGNVLNVYLEGGRVRWISWIFIPEPGWPVEQPE